MTASDVASVNEFPDVCAVIQLMDPSGSRASDDNTTYQVYMSPTFDILCLYFCWKWKIILLCRFVIMCIMIITMIHCIQMLRYFL